MSGSTGCQRMRARCNAETSAPTPQTTMVGRVPSGADDMVAAAQPATDAPHMPPCPRGQPEGEAGALGRPASGPMPADNHRILGQGPLRGPPDGGRFEPQHGEFGPSSVRYKRLLCSLSSGLKPELDDVLRWAASLPEGSPLYVHQTQAKPHHGHNRAVVGVSISLFRHGGAAQCVAHHWPLYNCRGLCSSGRAAEARHALDATHASRRTRCAKGWPCSHWSKDSRAR